MRGIRDWFECYNCYYCINYPIDPRKKRWCPQAQTFLPPSFWCLIGRNEEGTSLFSSYIPLLVSLSLSLSLSDLVMFCPVAPFETSESNWILKIKTEGRRRGAERKRKEIHRRGDPRSTCFNNLVSEHKKSIISCQIFRSSCLRYISFPFILSSLVWWYQWISRYDTKFLYSFIRSF